MKKNILVLLTFLLTVNIAYSQDSVHSFLEKLLTTKSDFIIIVKKDDDLNFVSKTYLDTFNYRHEGGWYQDKDDAGDELEKQYRESKK